VDSPDTYARPSAKRERGEGFLAKLVAFPVQPSLGLEALRVREGVFVAMDGVVLCSYNGLDSTSSAKASASPELIAQEVRTPFGTTKAVTLVSHTAERGRVAIIVGSLLSVSLMTACKYGNFAQSAAAGACVTSPGNAALSSS